MAGERDGLCRRVVTVRGDGIMRDEGEWRDERCLALTSGLGNFGMRWEEINVEASEFISQFNVMSPALN